MKVQWSFQPLCESPWNDAVLIAQAGSPAGEQAVLHGTAALRDGGWAGTLIVHWTPSSGSILDSADDTAPRAQHRQ